MDVPGDRAPRPTTLRGLTMSAQRDYEVQFLVRVSVKAPDIETASNAPGIEVTAFNRPGQTPVEITDVSSEWEYTKRWDEETGEVVDEWARTAQTFATMKRRVMMSETEERVDTFHIRVAFEFDADKQQGISFVHSVKSVQPTAAELLKLMHCYRSEETEGLLRDVR